MQLSHFILGMGTFEVARRQCKNVELNQVFSFEEFRERESIIKHNYPDTIDSIYLDSYIDNLYPKKNWTDISPALNQVKKVDLICSLTPCGQLSNLTKSNDPTVKGVESEKNRWIYESVKAFIASNSTYFMMENSDHLSRARGFAIIENIKKIFVANNIQDVKIHMIRSNALSYGLPQHRERTILLMYRNSKFFDIPFEDARVNLIDYLNSLERKPNDTNDIIFKPYNIQNNWEVFMKENDSLLNEYKKNFSSENFSGERIHKFIKEYPYVCNDTKLEKVLNKIKNGETMYDESPLFTTNSIGAIIRKCMGRSINPLTNKYFTVRELMYLMGYPPTFDLVDIKKQYTLFYKAVPVPVAKYFIEYLSKDKKELTLNKDIDVLIQVNNHRTGKREFYDSELNPIPKKEPFSFSFQE